MAKIITVTLNPCLDRTIRLNGFEKGEVNRAEKSRLDAGGKGINVSRALKNFGVENIALGIIGGENGETLKRKLKAEGVSFDFVEVCGETRTNYKIFDEKSGETTDINEQGIALTQSDLDVFFENCRKHLQGAEYLVLAGSIPPGLPDSIYRELTELAQGDGVRVILDASGASFREGIKAKPYAIKPNLHEFEELLQRPLKTTAEIADAAREVIGTGVERVVVSLGAEGAVFADSSAVCKTGIFAVETRSTVGCGDSMVAGMVYSLLNGFDAEKTARLSAAAGSITAGKEGTSMCILAEVEQAFCGIPLERL